MPKTKVLILMLAKKLMLHENMLHVNKKKLMLHKKAISPRQKRDDAA